MRKTKLHNLFAITIATFFLITISIQSYAANKGEAKVAQPSKERLVLMPIRVPEEDKNLTGAMETALVKGLQQKYDVFSGERVAQKAHEIFMKETRNPTHTECDETRCMQNIAEAFQSELIATANVTRQGGNYFLALSIQNIFDNKVVYSESLPCEGCSQAQIVDKLKELSGSSIAAESKKIILSCEGPDTVAGVPDELIKGNNIYDKENTHQVFEVTENSILVKGGRHSPDITLSLCNQSESEYIYSDNCEVKSVDYLRDWYSEKDHLIYVLKDWKHPSPFFRKYGKGNNIFAYFEVLKIGRTNSDVDWVVYSPVTGPISGSPTEKNGYLMIDHSVMNCKKLEAKF